MESDATDWPVPDLSETFHRAVQALGSGRSEIAEDLCRRILADSPRYFDAHHLLGLASANRGDYAGALEHFDQAMALRPDDAQLLSNRGLALRRLERLDEALDCLDTAVRIAPELPAALVNRASVLLGLMRPEAALADLDAALAVEPDLADAHGERGSALLALDRNEEALTSFDRALAIESDLPVVHHNRATALVKLARCAEAVAAADAALALKPDYVAALATSGGALHAMNRHTEAREVLDRALAIEPDSTGLRISRCTAELAVVYRSEAEIDARRNAFAEQLAALAAGVMSDNGPADFVDAIATADRFYLPYQGRNDRELQALFGTAACHDAARRFGAAPLPPPPRTGEKIRLGIVSAYFRMHSNWKMRIRGWLEQIDRERFEIFGYHTSPLRDTWTDVAAASCRRFVSGPRTIDAWRAEIIADAPHILLYPEIGMAPTTQVLAAQRLARVQCMSWSHPVTSGLPTIDYFLTNDLMEGPDGEAHYTERLVRLPNLSVYYEPLALDPVRVTRAQYGVREGATAFWSCQSPFKFLPQHDRVFPAIAREAGDCQFLFIAGRDPEIAEDFRDRLVDAFAAQGLDCDDYCVFLPQMPMDEFGSACGLCDVFLDSIGWSGCNTTLESLEHNLPIVTLPGTLMRARHSAGILNMMGVEDTVARDIDHYIALAVRLARDPAWRAEISAKIAANKHRLYRDRTAIVALEDFLERACRAA